ncbi:ThuA domain-containing protein [Candidatus Bathyarchaeota archaeon]|nr:ThuA domain-containing protein [Candidatus Bathyarchaeota archaeon]
MNKKKLILPTETKRIEVRTMKNLLMITHSAGFKHDYLPIAREVLKRLGLESGLFNVVATDECNLLTQEGLKKFDAVLFATTGELPLSDEHKMDLIEAIKGGKGFIGVHNATDTFYKFPEYGKMIGGYFQSHPWTQEVTVIVEDRDHPATRHLPDKFRVKEEVYTFRDWSRERTRVLISLDNSSVDLGKGTRPDNDYALCWCHNYGEGRVFYTAFGHFKELWSERWFQKHLLNGILWTMNMLE